MNAPTTTRTGDNALAIARDLAPNTEHALLPADHDPQLHVARHDAPPPYFLICEKDCVLTQLSGSGRLEFQYSNVRYHRLSPGDIVYVPAGTPHRYLPARESVQVRYKAPHPRAEAIAWFCTRCANELFRHTFDPEAVPLSEGYRAGLSAFESDPESHTCTECGHA